MAAVAVRLMNLALIQDIRLHAFIEDSPIYWNGEQAWIDAGFFARSGPYGFANEAERMPLYFLFLVPFRRAFENGLLGVLVT